MRTRGVTKYFRQPRFAWMYRSFAVHEECQSWAGDLSEPDAFKDLDDAASVFDCQPLGFGLRKVKGGVANSWRLADVLSIDVKVRFHFSVSLK